MSVTGTDLAVKRRRRLTALEEAFDAGVLQERQGAVRVLLNQPLVVAENPEYRLIRTHGEWLRTWFAHHVDWQLTITAEAARLRKTPAILDDASRPCRDPKSGAPLSRQGYVYLCLLMAALVRSDRQTTLGALSQELGGHLRAEPAFEDLGIRAELRTPAERRELVGAVRLLLDWGVLLRIQGDEENYTRDREADVLYTVNRPVLSRILAATNAPSLVTGNSFEARLASTHGDFLSENEEARHRRWRTHFFRRLLDDPVVYYDGLSEDERLYLDRQRGSILTEIENATGLVREVRSEGIAMVDTSGRLTDYKLPEDGTEGHLTLLLAEHLAGELRQNPSSEVRVDMEALVKFSQRQISEHHRHWRKNVRDAGQERVLTELVVTRLDALRLLRREGDSVVPLPALGRYALAKLETEEPELL